VHRKQDALLRPDAKLHEACGEASHPALKFSKSEAPPVVDIGELARSVPIGFKQVASNVEVLGWGSAVLRCHAVSFRTELRCGNALAE
jgi:hypothetical protein